MLSAPPWYRPRWPRSATGLQGCRLRSCWDLPRASWHHSRRTGDRLAAGGDLAVPSGETTWCIFLVLWSALLVGNIDNVIRPLFVSRGSSLPLLVVLVGILGGAMALGFIGSFSGRRPRDPLHVDARVEPRRVCSAVGRRRPATRRFMKLFAHEGRRRQVDQQAYGPDGSVKTGAAAASFGANKRKR